MFLKGIPPQDWASKHRWPIMNIQDFEGIDAEFAAKLHGTLPDTAKAIASIIGLERTLALVAVLGGAELRFPRGKHGPAASRFEELALVIGEESLSKLAHEYTYGESVYIPICTITRRRLRNRKIRREFDDLTKTLSGKQAVNTLAIKNNMSNRQVEKILNWAD